MIFIEQKRSAKVVGETSLFISVIPHIKPYIDDVKKIIESLDGSNYSKRTKLWEVPLSYLSELIDKLCFIDEIAVKILNENTAIKSTIHLPSLRYKTQPFKYQLEGIEYGLNHDKWLLLDVPGLGKTITALYIAQDLKSIENIQHCLIICGLNTLKENWRKEVHKHSNLDCCILGGRINRRGRYVVGSVSDRLNHLNKPIDEFYTITNIETLRDDRIIDALLNGPNKFDMIVLDEAHVIKNPNSQQSTNLLKLTAKYQIAMTGTLLLNSPLDAYVPLSWLGIERSTYTNFKKYYCILGGEKKNILCGYKNTKLLKETIEKYSLRRTKDLLDLPPKIVIDEIIEMDSSQDTFYDNLKNGIRDQVDKVKLNTSNILALSSRLRQATACPQVLTSENITCAKLERAVQLTEEIISNNEKVVIFCTYKESVYRLQEMLREFSPIIATGDIKDELVAQHIDEFQNNPEKKIFICTWQKCGTGITLTAASYEIFIDTPWTMGVWEQCQDRCYRIGTKKQVTIYNLITAKTIDEHVLDILNTKGAISDYMIDGKITQDGINILKKYITDL